MTFTLVLCVYISVDSFKGKAKSQIPDYVVICFTLQDGWLSGWFGRLKKNGPKNVHLPDDSKPSVSC